MKYTQTAQLTGEHSKGITSLVFNASGSFLASASLDGAVCIWDTKTWLLLDVYNSKTPISSIRWATEDSLVCGLSDGILAILVKNGEKLTKVSGFWAHLYPIEHLAFSGAKLGSGAQQELSIWHWDTADTAKCCVIKSLPLPQAQDSNAKSKKSPVLRNGGSPEFQGKQSPPVETFITGVSWAPSCLVVTYLNHGIRFFDGDSYELLRVIDPQTSIVTSSLSANGAFLAASSLTDGLLIYDLDSGKAIRTFKLDEEDGRATQVLFIHGGHAVLRACTVGRVRIWFVSSGRKLPSLCIPDGEKVLALAAHYNSTIDRFFIATGTMSENSPSSTFVWTAATQDTDDEETGEAPGTKDTSAAVNNVKSLHSGKLMLRAVTCITLLLLLLCAFNYTKL